MCRVILFLPIELYRVILCLQRCVVVILSLPIELYRVILCLQRCVE